MHDDIGRLPGLETTHDSTVRLFLVCEALGLVLVGALLGAGHWILSAAAALAVVAAPYAVAMALLLRSGR